MVYSRSIYLILEGAKRLPGWDKVPLCACLWVAGSATTIWATSKVQREEALVVVGLPSGYHN